MRLNKSTSHAIRILIECARQPGELTKAAALSGTLDITLQNTLKIVNILSRAQLLEAVRGRNGGMRLARPAAQIRMGDIVRAMETTDIELDVDTTEGRGASTAELKGVNRVLDDALEAFVAVLDRHTLADLASRTDARMSGMHRRKPSKTSPPNRRRTTPRQRAGV